MLKNKFLMLVVALAMLVAMTGVAMAATSSDSADVLISATISGDGTFSVDATKTTNAISLNKMYPDGTPVSAVTVSVVSTYPYSWALDVTSDTGFMKQNDASIWLHNPAQIGYNSVWHNMAIGHIDQDPHTMSPWTIATGSGNNNLDIWYNQPMASSDPDVGTFDITLTFTGTML